MKNTVPDSSSPRRDPLCSHSHYTLNPALDSVSLDLVAVLPGAHRTFGPSLIKPSQELLGLLCIHCVSPPAFSTCSRILFKISIPVHQNPYFPKSILIIEMKELNLHVGVEILEVHRTKKPTFT